MRNDKTVALKLRLRGSSYAQIQATLGIPKSTLSGWFSQTLLSTHAKAKIALRVRQTSLEGLLRHNKSQTIEAQRRAQKIRRQASRIIGLMNARELLLVGTALYWAEGYKRPILRNGQEVTYHVVALTNSDPALVLLFLRFLRETCKIPAEKIKLGLRIFPHQNEQAMKLFWHTATKIPYKNFEKTQRVISSASQGKRPFNRLPYGVVRIVVAHTALYHQIMGYIEGMKKIG